MPGASPALGLLHGELQLTFPDAEDLVQNDRERLVPSQTTEAILDWVSAQLWQQAQAIEGAQRAKERQAGLLKASVLNEAFNSYAKQFLEELQTEIFVDFIDDPVAVAGGWWNWPWADRTGPRRRRATQGRGRWGCR